MNSNPTISFKDSLKSWDTENLLDRIFYRPIGFKIAVFLRPTPITPNAITIISIFVGVLGCSLFYPDELSLNLIGFALLVFANILDCVDGQLARITGIKSRIGRILDGFCGDIWFLTFYSAICLRLLHGTDRILSPLGFEWGWWVVFIALASAYSHFNQAAMVDYYKTLHLHMLKGGRNSEFENADSVRIRYAAMTWQHEPISKAFTKLYLIYTLNQEQRTPKLRQYIRSMHNTYPDGFPEEKIAEFREKSLKMMPLLDSFTFNARSIVILLTLLLDVEWLYFVFEILILNPLLIFAIHRHEKMCMSLVQQ
jgi:phosphatidylglycerophosphate synthase